jgi:hypothetical protein
MPVTNLFLVSVEKRNEKKEVGENIYEQYQLSIHYD